MEYLPNEVNYIILSYLYPELCCLFFLSHVSKHWRQLCYSYHKKRNMWLTINNGSYRLNPECFKYYMSLSSRTSLHEITMDIALDNSNLELASWLNEHHKITFISDHLGNALSRGNMNVIYYLAGKGVNLPENKFEQACIGGIKMLMFLDRLGHRINKREVEHLCEICVLSNTYGSKESLVYLIQNYDCSKFIGRIISAVIQSDSLDSFLILIHCGHIKKLDTSTYLLIVTNNPFRITKWLKTYGANFPT